MMLLNCLDLSILPTISHFSSFMIILLLFGFNFKIYFKFYCSKIDKNCIFAMKKNIIYNFRVIELSIIKIVISGLQRMKLNEKRMI